MNSTGVFIKTGVRLAEKGPSTTTCQKHAGPAAIPDECMIGGVINMGCVYCDKQCVEGQDLFKYDVHQKCNDEWLERDANDRCVKCGEPRESNGFSVCDGCKRYDELGGFKGYDGP